MLIRLRKCAPAARCSLVANVGVPLLALFSLAAVAVLPSPARAQQCDTTWAEPKALALRDGRLVFVEHPSTLVTSRGTLLVGAPSYHWWSPSAFVDTSTWVPTSHDPQNAGVKLGAGAVAEPIAAVPTSRVPYSMMAMVDRGRALAIWATTNDTTPSRGLKYDALWTATLEDSGWSRPEEIWRSQHLRWHRTLSALIDHHGTALAALGVIDSTRRPAAGLLVLHRQEERWRPRWIDAGSRQPRGVELLSLDRDSVLVALISTTEIESAGPNNVVVKRLAVRDTGRAAPSRLVHDAGSSAPHDLQLLRLGSTIALVWRSLRSDGVTSDTLYESTSIDRGVTWTRPAPLPLSHRYVDFRAVVTSDHDAMGTMLELGTRRVRLLTRRGGRWSLDSTHFAARTPSAIALLHGRLTLTYGVGRPTPAPEGIIEAPVTMFTSRALRCTTPPARPWRR